MTSGARRLAAVAAVAALALAFPLVASARSSSAALARKGIARAHATGWLKTPQARLYRGDVYLALQGVRHLPRGRGAILESQLSQVSAVWQSYIAPRALAVFSQLRENRDYLRAHPEPTHATDVTGPDGVVYRWFAGKGFEFHPLANFGKLNTLVAQKNTEATRELADALVARAVPRAGTLRWEYAFPYGGGAPWTSGLAQAVAAQSLARASVLLDDPSLLAAARKAYLAVAGSLSVPTSAGPWVRLYSWSRGLVLNAQLQTVLSLRSYATLAGDTQAQAFADRMLTAAQQLFGRFDTGDWSLYELGGRYASTSYQEFVTDLLAKLADATDDPFWQAAATRFVNYTYEAPDVEEGGDDTPLVTYPQPADGWLDSVRIPFTLSKRATVTVSIAGKTVATLKNVAGGDRSVTWTPPPDMQPGTYDVLVRAVDFEGRAATYALEPVTVAWDTLPPPLTAQLDTTTGTLTWSTTDAGTPWLSLSLQLTDPAGVQPPQTIDLGQQPPSGTLQVTLPPGTWTVTLTGTNSAALATTVPLAAGSPPAP
ncbi:MAG TPA: D-glucuronyl C5-epimerase family protein [Gaiellaceae bacterium]|nr:D-glucuronyl C5-epimerase family protein [Gaiellaceae bacterium]